MVKFEVWMTKDGLHHWQRIDDSGHVASPQNSYDRPIDCNNALERQRRRYPGAQIVRVDKPTKG